MSIIMSNRKNTPVPERKPARTPQKTDPDTRAAKEHDQLYQSARKARRVWQRDPGAYNFGVNDDGLIQAALDEINGMYQNA